MFGRLNRRWVRITIYYLIALALSFLARFVWTSEDVVDPAQGLWGIYRHLAAGLGPFVGALLIWIAFRPERRMSFGGTFPAMGAAMLLVPTLVMAVVGINNPFAIDPHLFGACMGIYIALYALLEETGWRGYLQDELRDRPALLKYALIGVLWYLWHFSFLSGRPVSAEFVNLLFIVLASIGIGYVADLTRSIFAAASFHLLGNVIATSATFDALPMQESRTWIALACLVVWIAMLRAWRVRNRRALETSAAVE